MNALQAYELQQLADYFRPIDAAHLADEALSEKMDDVDNDIQLGRGTVAQDVSALVNGDELDKHMPIMFRHLTEQDESKDTPIEKMIRGLMVDAVEAYSKVGMK